MQEESKHPRSQNDAKVEESDRAYRLARFYAILLKADRSWLISQINPGENWDVNDENCDHHGQKDVK